MGRVTVKRSRVLEQLRELGATQKHVAVGVLGAPGVALHREFVVDAAGVAREVPGEHTVAQIAQWNHYGTSRIPARPFITLALAKHAIQLRRLQARLATGLVQGKLILDQALGLLGLEAVNAIKQTIADGVPPPNAPRTIAAKGSSTPLINFGQLRGSVIHEIRSGVD